MGIIVDNGISPYTLAPLRITYAKLGSDAAFIIV